jgi:hypothetical protein
MTKEQVENLLTELEYWKTDLNWVRGFAAALPNTQSESRHTLNKWCEGCEQKILRVIKMLEANIA